MNNTADALSRLTLEEKIFSYDSEDVDEKLTYSSSNINSIGFTEIDSNDLKEAQQNDPLIAELKFRLESEPEIENFELKWTFVLL